MRPIGTFIFGALLAAGLIGTAFGQVVRPLPGVARPLPGALPLPSHPTHTCNTAPPPAVQIEVRATFVHLTWNQVFTADHYHIDRTSSGTPNDTPTVLPPSVLRTLNYWDAIQDPRYSYTYSVSAIQTDNCYGTTQVTVPASSFTMPNPQYALVTRTIGNVGAIRWSPVSWAMAYRVDGPGLSVTMAAGHFLIGTVPVLCPYSNGLRDNVPADPSCPQCSLYLDVPNVGPNYTQYSITALFYGNWPTTRTTQRSFGHLSNCVRRAGRRPARATPEPA